jgi:ABC-type Na+ transport system ATPase subunit NatA/DNA-binding CsgD family transcriptional regulator
VPVIEVEHLHKRYRDTVAVEDVSLTVEAGGIFGIVGPNGAGKTTTVELIEGLRTPDRGHVRVLGLDPWRDRAELRQRVGVQLQQSDLYDKVRVGEALELFASFYRDPADPGRLLERLGLAGKRDTSFDKLSGGQRQRLSIALALVGSPKVAILDELSTGLDPHARRDTWRLIEQVRAGGVTVVLVSHVIEHRSAAYRLGTIAVAGLAAGWMLWMVTLHPSWARRRRLMAAVEPLTQRELEVLQLIASGTTNREAARRLFISEASVKAHLLHVYAKLGVNDRAAAVATAYERGLLTPGGGE